MPKTSKLKTVTNTKPQKHVPDFKHDFYCCRCGKTFTHQDRLFPSSQSTIYRGNNGYLPVCNKCVDELYDHYREVLDSDAEAVRRICSKFDIYWNVELYNMTNKSATGASRIRSYISRSNLYKYVGKTYDDTLDEEKRGLRAKETDIIKDIGSVRLESDKNPEGAVISEDVVRYWGTGFTPEMYIELENRRNYWLSHYPEGTVLNPGEEGILRQICNLEISINQDRAAGRSFEKSVNTLNTLFGSMNIKPSQKRENEENYIPFGVEIKRFEDERPVIEVDDDFKDVDGLKKNVLAWFTGSLCKTAGIKNEYSRYFEEEISKYTVERPTFDEDESTEG